MKNTLVLHPDLLATALDEIAYHSAASAIARGKLHDYRRGLADILEEVAEAMREESPYYIKDGKPEGYLVELADVILASLTVMNVWHSTADKSLGKVIVEKMLYNYTRED